MHSAVLHSADTPEQTESTRTQWQRFSVPFEFPVCFTRDLFEASNRTLLDTVCRIEPVKRHRLLVFLDQGVLTAHPELPAAIAQYASRHASALELVRAPVIMSAGEDIKTNVEGIDHMHRIVADERLDRHSFIVGIGGGALLDAVGLVAATAHRGIRHIRIPTTVLAQNDSGVGVKNGVNRFGQKNYFGTFAPPFAVLNDSRFIDSLPARDKIAGMAEAVKVALIRDEDFFYWLEESAPRLAAFEPTAMTTLIERCAALHMRQIGLGGDPFESGSARPLDFGHWAAHRLETLTAHELRHGEAVAIGLAIDTRYSVMAGLLTPGVDRRLCDLLLALGFSLWHPAMDARDGDGQHRLMSGLADFREHLGGELTITLLDAVGSGIEVHELKLARVLASIDWLRTRYGSPLSAV